MGDGETAPPPPVIKRGRKFGAYRFVQYLDDGVTQYQCMDCKNMFAFRDDPATYNFCPKCGMSWFKRLHTRPHDLPRWVWDRYGEDYPFGLNIHCDLFKPIDRHWYIDRLGPLGQHWKNHTRVAFKPGSWRAAASALSLAKAEYPRSSFRVELF